MVGGENKMDKKTITAIVVVALVLVVMGVAYAALSATLNIKGTTIVKKQNWEINFTQIDSVSAVDADGKGPQAVNLNGFSGSAATITWGTTLNVPGDYAEFIAKLENRGTIDAVVASDNYSLGVAASSTTNVIDYSVCYVKGIDDSTYVNADGTDSSSCVSPSIGDVFYGTTNVDETNKKFGVRYVKVKVNYDSDKINESGDNLQDFDSSFGATGENDKTLKMTTSIPFIQYTGN